MSSPCRMARSCGQLWSIGFWIGPGTGFRLESLSPPAPPCSARRVHRHFPLLGPVRNPSRPGRLQVLAIRCEQLKIIRMVVRAVLVDVMDHFVRLKQPAELLLHHETVLSHIARVVRTGMLRTIPQDVSVLVGRHAALPVRMKLSVPWSCAAALNSEPPKPPVYGVQGNSLRFRDLLLCHQSDLVHLAKLSRVEVNSQIRFWHPILLNSVAPIAMQIVPLWMFVR